jgi:hypothetical protein
LREKKMESNDEAKKPTCKLVGTDGNVFAVIGNVRDALRRAGQTDRAKEFSDRAMSCGSYDEVLALVHDYVEVR